MKKKFKLAALGLALLAPLAGIATVSLPYTFQPNTSISSSQVNANFGALRDEINGHEASRNPHQTRLQDVLSANNSAATYSIDLNENQLLRMRVENLSSDPAAGNAGRLFFNTTASQLKLDNGSSIAILGGTGLAPLNSPTFLGTVTTPALNVSGATASRVLVTDPSKNVTASSVTTTTLGYLDATSSIQTQLDGKQATGSYITTLTSDVSASGPGSTSATVNSVGGSTATAIHTAEVLANAATSSNTSSAIVKRDSSGNFSAGTITASLSGNATSATNAATVATTTNSTYYPLIVASSSNSNQAHNLSTGFTVNPSTNNVTATTFTGSLTGTASGNTTYTPNQYGVVVSGSGNAMSVIAPSSSTTKVLTSGGASANPSWQDVPSAPSQSYELSNLGFATSVGSNQLTIALKQSDGTTDPSSGSAAVKIGMRSSTATSGAYNQRTVTSALSLVVSSGATLGHVNGATEYVWIYAIDNAGTVELAVSGSYMGDEGNVITTTTMSGSATSRVTMYSGTGRSNVPYRLIGRATVSEVTAGTWASNATVASVYPFQRSSILTNANKSFRVESASINGSSSLSVACTTGSCTINKSSGSWLTATRSSNGTYALTFATGIFSDTPICTCSTYNQGQVCDAQPGGSTSYTIETFASNTTTKTDEPVKIICMGPM